MSQNHETKNKLYGHRLQIGASEATAMDTKKFGGNNPVVCSGFWDAIHIRNIPFIKHKMP
jgi:hypothetical protein